MKLPNRERGSSPVIVLLLLLIIILMAVFIWFLTRNKPANPKQETVSPNAASQWADKKEPTPVEPKDAFTLWFDQEKTTLDRSDTGNVVRNVITNGTIVGFVGAKQGKMKKLEYSFYGCSATACQETTPVYRTVFNEIQEQNPVPFTITLLKGDQKEEEGWTIGHMVFRLEDDKGNMLEPLEQKEQGDSMAWFQTIASTTKFSIEIGGGIGTSHFRFPCNEEGKQCKKEWIGQPYWYKPN